MKYLVWRGGRPRWSPGPNLRARGFKSKDLRHPSGEWMRLSEAIAAAQKLNENAEVRSTIPEDVAEREAALARNLLQGRQGYVYFMFTGGRVKVGFSTAPFRRGASIGPASGVIIDMFAFVPGTEADEKGVHKVLATNRIEGEWFYASQHAMNLILRSLRNRKITLDTSPV